MFFIEIKTEMFIITVISFSFDNIYYFTFFIYNMSCVQTNISIIVSYFLKLISCKLLDLTKKKKKTFKLNNSS